MGTSAHWSLTGRRLWIEHPHNFCVGAAASPSIKSSLVYRFNKITVESKIESKITNRESADKLIDKINKQLDSPLKNNPLIEALELALLRYSQTHNVQNVSDSISNSLEMLSIKQDSENSIIRYLIWAIPSVGFIGTVRGIGGALANLI